MNSLYGQTFILSYTHRVHKLRSVLKLLSVTVLKKASKYWSSFHLQGQAFLLETRINVPVNRSPGYKSTYGSVECKVGLQFVGWLLATRALKTHNINTLSHIASSYSGSANKEPSPGHIPLYMVCSSVIVCQNRHLAAKLDILNVYDLMK